MPDTPSAADKSTVRHPNQGPKVSTDDAPGAKDRSRQTRPGETEPAGGDRPADPGALPSGAGR